MNDSGSNFKLDEATLIHLAKRYPVCKDLLSYRKCAKLIGTYLEPNTKRALISEDRRIHPSVWNTSKTGRRRTSKPNSQNFTVATDPRMDIRSCVMAPPGYKMLVSDLSQIELRVCAHISQDEEMMRAYSTWQCTACGSTGSGPIYLTHCPECGEFENEQVLKGARGFWHGLDIHQVTADNVGVKRQIAKCVHPSTLVNVSGSLRRIGTLSPLPPVDTFCDLPPTLVQTPTGFSKASQFYNGGEKDCVLIATNKSVMRCSENHLLRTKEGGWKKACELTGGDLLADPIPAYGLFAGDDPHLLEFNPFWENEGPLATVALDERWAYIAGAFIGDGSISNASGVYFSCGSDEAGAEYAKWAGSLLEILHDVGLQAKRSKCGKSIYVGSRRVIRFFNRMGLRAKKGVDIEIPDWVLSSSKRSVAFLAGLIDTDGTICRKRGAASITTRCPRLTADLCALYSNLGWAYTLTHSYNPTYKKWYHLIQTKDADALRSIQPKLRYQKKAERILRSLEKPYNPRYMPHKVKYVKAIGKHPVVDIQVDPEHCYSADLFDSHNSINFAAIYMATAWKMEQQFGVFTKDRWQVALDAFFNSYVGIKRWHRQLTVQLNKTREVRDIFNRRRKIPASEIAKSFKHSLNMFVNFPVQSSAGTYLTLVEEEIRNSFRECGWWMTRVFPSNEVHDEVIFVVEEEIAQTAADIIQHHMRYAYPLSIPVNAGMSIVESWDQGK